MVHWIDGTQGDVRAIEEKGISLVEIIKAVRTHYPKVQAAYLFGSWGTEYALADSGVDIALLTIPESLFSTLHGSSDEADAATDWLHANNSCPVRPNKSGSVD